MRRALTMLAPFVLVLSVASPVSAAPPTKEPQEAFSSDFAPGETCDFAVRVATTAIKAKTTTFNRKDGQFKQNLTGKITEPITNLETGASVVRNSSGPGKVSIYAARHLVLRFGGASVLTFFDVTSPAAACSTSSAAAPSSRSATMVLLRPRPVPGPRRGSVRDPRLITADPR